MEDTRCALPARIYVSARRATAIYNLRAWKSEVHNLIRSFRSAWGGEKGVKQRTRYGVACSELRVGWQSAVPCRDHAAPHVFSSITAISSASRRLKQRLSTLDDSRSEMIARDGSVGSWRNFVKTFISKGAREDLSSLFRYIKYPSYCSKRLK